MATRKQVHEIQTALDRAMQALDDLIDARATQNEGAAKDAIGRISFELGSCKDLLHGVPADQPARGEGMRMPGQQVDPRRRMIEYAGEARAKAQETMVTVSSGALALSVTFRGALV